MIADSVIAEPAQALGGDWTEQKLKILREYLSAFTSALRNQPFDLHYIDAFAGTGYREIPADPSKGLSPFMESFFEEQTTDEAQQFFDGSARIALQTVPSFDRLFFVEQSKKRFAELTKVVHDFTDIADRVTMINDDCNAVIPMLCAPSASGSTASSRENSPTWTRSGRIG